MYTGWPQSLHPQISIGRPRGKTRRVTLGRHGPLTPDQARTQAKKLHGKIAEGVDVANRAKEERAALTFAELSKQFMERHGQSKLKERSAIEYQRLLNNVLVPHFGRSKIKDISYQDVEHFHSGLYKTQAQANRSIAVLSKMMNWAIKLGERPDRVNPCIGIEKYREKSRDRVLSDAELRAFWAATEVTGFPFGPAFRILLLSAQRREEVMSMTWQELALEEGAWTIGGTRTKNHRGHQVALSSTAVEILSSIPRRCDFVFSTNGKNSPSGFSKAKSRLDRIMTEKLGEEPPEWRLHDLRRTAATRMAALDILPNIIERVLNHQSGVNSGLVSIYQKHEYKDAQRSAVLSWNMRLLEIVGAHNE